MPKKELDIEMLRKAWDEGKRSGIAGRYDMRAIVNDAKAETLENILRGIVRNSAKL